MSKLIRASALIAVLLLVACAGGTPNLRPLPPPDEGNINITGGAHVSGLLPNPQFGVSLGVQAAPIPILWFDGGAYGQLAAGNAALVGGDIGTRLVLRTPVLDLGLVLRGTGAATVNQGLFDFEVDGGAGLYAGLQLGPIALALQPTVGIGRAGASFGTGPGSGVLVVVGRLPVALSLHLGPVRLTAEAGATARSSFTFTETLLSPHAALGLSFTFGKPPPATPP